MSNNVPVVFDVASDGVILIEEISEGISFQAANNNAGIIGYTTELRSVSILRANHREDRQTRVL